MGCALPACLVSFGAPKGPNEEARLAAMKLLGLDSHMAACPEINLIVKVGQGGWDGVWGLGGHLGVCPKVNLIVKVGLVWGFRAQGWPVWKFRAQGWPVWGFKAQGWPVWRFGGHRAWEGLDIVPGRGLDIGPGRGWRVEAPSTWRASVAQATLLHSPRPSLPLLHSPKWHAATLNPDPPLTPYTLLGDPGHLAGQRGRSDPAGQ